MIRIKEKSDHIFWELKIKPFFFFFVSKIERFVRYRDRNRGCFSKPSLSRFCHQNPNGHSPCPPPQISPPPQHCRRPPFPHPPPPLHQISTVDLLLLTLPTPATATATPAHYPILRSPLPLHLPPRPDPAQTRRHRGPRPPAPGPTPLDLRPHLQLHRRLHRHRPQQLPGPIGLLRDPHRRSREIFHKP